MNRRNALKALAGVAVGAVALPTLVEAEPFNPITDDTHAIRMVVKRVSRADEYVRACPMWRVDGDYSFVIPVVNGPPPQVGDVVTVWRPYKDLGFWRGRAINDRIQHYSPVDYTEKTFPAFDTGKGYSVG